MRRAVASLMVVLIVVVMVTGFGITSYASDWDKAGKVFAAIEGIRVLTGGNVDIIGSITGIKQNSKYARQQKCHEYEDVRDHRCSKCVWVPYKVWEKEYIPEHKEYSKKYGTIIVEGHYIRYKVENGGHWEQDCSSCFK